jgi:hypothetical protein
LLKAFFHPRTAALSATFAFFLPRISYSFLHPQAHSHAQKGLLFGGFLLFILLLWKSASPTARLVGHHQAAAVCHALWRRAAEGGEEKEEKVLRIGEKWREEGGRGGEYVKVSIEVDW